MIIYSFSDPQLVSKGIYFAPIAPTGYNFVKVSRITLIYTSTLISVLRTVIGAIVTLFCCMFFAFIITKEALPARKLIYRFTIMTMYINAGLIPYYLTVRAYGLRNNFLVYIIPGAVNAFYVILFKTFIEQIPASLEESAMIDGAGVLAIFARIIVPVSTPIIAAIAVFSAVGQWNSWFDTYIFVSNKGLFTLQYILLNFLRESQALADSMRTSGSTSSVIPQRLTSMSVKMTATTIVLIPILLVYPFLQRYFLKGIMIGAIKG